MNNIQKCEILVLTTHYPFGTIQENWIEPELVEFSHRFSRVHILPIKELNGRRDLPEGIQLLAPLAGLNRIAFFARQALRLDTWRYFFSAMRECAAGPGLTQGRAIVNLKFACYRAALEADARIEDFLASPGAKVVYAYWGHLAALAIPKARANGAATCVRYHASDLYVHRPETSGFYPWRQLMRDAADLNAFISEHGLRYFSALDYCPARGLSSVFRLGCRDFGKPKPRTLIKTKPHIVMVSASWIHPIKRVEEIAKLAGAIARLRPITWHHFGGGKNKAVDQAIEFARADGAEIVLHGIVEVEDIQRFYRENSISFFVNLSRDEGIPVSIMEALNADIPIVATAVGGTPEVVIEGQSGMLVDPNLKTGPNDLARHILSALEPGGSLGAARPRQVWESLCNANNLAITFANKLQSLAEEVPVED